MLVDKILKKILQWKLSNNYQIKEIEFFKKQFLFFKNNTTIKLLKIYKKYEFPKMFILYFLFQNFKKNKIWKL
jgi:hypothetical protein